MADYCEAYLATNGLCNSGSKCCVSRDNYPDKVPADFRVPIQMHSNHTISSKLTKSNMPTMTNSPRPKPPTKLTTSRPTKPQEPSRESIDGNHVGGQRPCDGNCLSSFFSLFCDKTDSDAHCPNDGTCCIDIEGENVKETTQKPQIVSSTVQFKSNLYLCFVKISHLFHFPNDSLNVQATVLHFF